MTTKRPQDEAFLDDQNDSAKKQKVEESTESTNTETTETINTEVTDQQATSAPAPVSQSADSEVSVSQPSQIQEGNGSESQGTPVSDEKKPKKPRAPPKPKTPKTPKKKPNISVKEINAAFRDFKLLPETLSVEDARAIFKAASRYKCLWEDNDWKTVFTRCWGGDKETTDASLQAFNSSIASTNVSFHVFSDKFVIKGNQRTPEAGKIDWFEFVATKDFSEELQEIFNEGVKWGNEAELKVFASAVPIDVRGLPASLEVTSVNNDDSFFVSEMETQLNHDPKHYKKVKDFFDSSFFRRYKYKASDEKFTLHYIKLKGTEERLVIGVIPQNKLYFGFYAVQKSIPKPPEEVSNTPDTPSSTDS